MGGKKTGMKYLMLRVGACLLSGIMISMVLIGNVGSFSWFTDTAAGSARFSVVSIEDIISSYGVDSEINPTKIQITKAEGLEFDPVLYFSVEGEASDYMRHIGPVRLKKRNEEIRLAVGITVVQYLKLVDSLDDKDTIKGRIRIKYLNEFIDESLDISFTREYLVDEFKRNIEELFSSKNQKGRMGANGSFSDLIIYLGESARWEEVDTEVRLNLTQFQEQVIDIFVPGLRQYISAAEDEVEKLTQRVETLQDRIDSLERQNASLGAEIDALKNQRSTGTAGLGGAGGET
ncbi:MAG: hypothetical protein QME73_10095, partial [Bacillota bacterium]|nr:hypothetical protein [Bacillota bacterium]